jgi:UDP-N-acetylmuramate dehydrogenase
MSLLSELTTLRLGGPAGRIVEARTEPAVVDAVNAADAEHEPLLVLAGGSNVVIADDGFPGTVVRILTSGIEEHRDAITVQAGEPWDPFVERAVQANRAGVEGLSGIPGSTGATPIQNVGAYGQEVAETIEWVRVYDRERDEVVTLPAAECGFDYRRSVFKYRDRWTVLAVAFRLQPSELSGPLHYAELARTLDVPVGGRAPLEDVRAAVLGLRRGKGMVIDPADPDSVSAGSFFTNPILSHEEWSTLEGAPAFPEPDGRIKTSAAWLIDQAGFRRGYGSGRIGISSKHTLALVNRGGGTTDELVALAREIAAGVEVRFGVLLKPEPVLVGLSW